jgi:hypothetical protein
LHGAGGLLAGHRFGRRVLLDERSDDRARDSEIVQIKDLIRPNVEDVGRVGDVGHQDFFANAGLDELDDVRERRS